MIPRIIDVRVSKRHHELVRPCLTKQDAKNPCFKETSTIRTRSDYASQDNIVSKSVKTVSVFITRHDVIDLGEMVSTYCRVPQTCLPCLEMLEWSTVLIL